MNNESRGKGLIASLLAALVASLIVVVTPSVVQARPVTVMHNHEPYDVETAQAESLSEDQEPQGPPIAGGVEINIDGASLEQLREYEQLIQADIDAIRFYSELAGIAILDTMGELTTTVEQVEAQSVVVLEAAEVARELNEESERLATIANDANEVAEQQRDAMVDAVIDLYIQPEAQAAASVQVMLGDPNDSTFAMGFLEVRTSRREDLTSQYQKQAKAAEDRMDEAVESARLAQESADEARELQTELETQQAELQVRIDELTEQSNDSVVQLWNLYALLMQVRQAIVEQLGGWGSMPPVAESDLVAIPNTSIRVHRLISDQVTALIVAAAMDGVVLDGWGWRSNQRQIELRQAHCGLSPYDVWERPSSECSPPTARPGRSQHERGFAIDFTQGGQTLNSSSTGFLWLQEHGPSFGLYNLPSEPWHWSIDGN